MAPYRSLSAAPTSPPLLRGLRLPIASKIYRNRHSNVFNTTCFLAQRVLLTSVGNMCCTHYSRCHGWLTECIVFALQPIKYSFKYVSVQFCDNCYEILHKRDPLREGELGPHLTQCRLGWGLPSYQVVSWYRLTTIDMGWKSNWSNDRCLMVGM